eukprot:COSAG05_NODE_319_length_11483_cov_406.525604_4_plen_258_part_00
MRLAAHLLHRGASPATFCLSLSLSVSVSLVSVRLSLSLSRPTSRILCAPVCVSVVCAAPACLSGCAFQAQCVGSSWQGAVSDIDQQEAAIPTWTAFSCVPSRHLSWLACLPRWPATVVDRGRRRSRGGRVRGRPAWVVCAMLAGGGSGATGLAKKRVCRRATRRAEGAARSDRSRESVVGAATMRLAAHLLHHGASPATFCLSLCVCVCVCVRAPVCVSIAAPACLSGCGFQVQCLVVGLRQEVALPQGGAPCYARD